MFSCSVTEAGIGSLDSSFADADELNGQQRESFLALHMQCNTYSFDRSSPFSRSCALELNLLSCLYSYPSPHSALVWLSLRPVA